MHRRRIRRLWFFALFFLLPWPLPVLGNAAVPSVRFWILGTVAASVGALEGAAGPVQGIIFLMCGWGLVTGALCWGIAWGLERVFRALPDRTALLATYSAITVGLAWALLFEPYRTPFGRALRGGLLQVLS